MLRVGSTESLFQARAWRGTTGLPVAHCACGMTMISTPKPLRGVAKAGSCAVKKTEEFNKVKPVSRIF